jgi:secondary thiamine-phosphate synthase enzyme
MKHGSAAESPNQTPNTNRALQGVLVMSVSVKESRLSVYDESFKIQSDRRPTFHDVTPQAEEALDRSGIRNGILMVYSQHTTCSVLIQEESHDVNYYGTPLLMQDLVNVLEKIIPTCRTEGQYHHPGPKHIENAVVGLHEEASWGLNTDAHLRSVIFGRSESVPVVDGKMLLGNFGRFWFVDFDQVRARERTVLIHIVGE